MKIIYLAAAFLSVGVAPLNAQENTDDRPTVTTTAQAEVRRAPDFATIAIGVTTLDSTATAAATAMNATLEAVFDTLIALGIPRDSLPTRRYTIQPEYNFDGGRELVGYRAEASVTVTIEELENIGIVIEGSLAAGANDVGSIAFGILDNREARNEALRLAVEEARQDAVALAEASGTGLGPLHEIHTGARVEYGQAEGLMNARVAPRQVVVPTDVVVTATVTASWYLQ